MSKLLFLEAAVAMMIGGPAHATSPSAAEMAEAARWASAIFTGQPVPPPEARLTVVANNDPVQLNARAGRPLRIGKAIFWRGLYCHAVSKVLVHLPSPGKTFMATVGVDSNEQTTGGRGSVVFAVNAAGREIFRSGLMREGTPGEPVNVDLGGAQELTLEVKDAGDGIACDQADWAEARVTLRDGRTIWLGDLPVHGQWEMPCPAEPPFSFIYDGRPSSELLRSWEFGRQSRELDAQRTEHVLTWTDAETGLVVRCVGAAYRDYPLVEWTVFFRNGGAGDTPLLESVQPLDMRLERYPLGEFTLHHHRGSPCTAQDYEPFATRLEPGASKRIAAAGGRPSNSDLPYFNVEDSISEGLIIAVGWPGQWAVEFTRDTERGLQVRAGQELTRLRLHPGEEIRTPLIVLQPWKGDHVRAQNVWRRWMLEHNLPRPFGKPVAPQVAACSSHQFGEMIRANTENQKFFVDRYLEEGLKLDYWWMDAGWYVNETGWPNTGTWEVDKRRFPNGLREITDHMHARGVRSIVWFEPERVTPGTWLYTQHPEWLLGRDGEQKLLNLGDPQARGWLTDHVDRLIVEQGIDLYRHDFNIDPLELWRANDPEDRQGMTEIRYVEGLLAFWDELRRRHPDMLIDTCASGGRRNDLETLRRAVPLLRSDYILEPVSQQLHTYGIAPWIPFYGTGVNAFDSYGYRSQMCPHITACYDMRVRDADYGTVRRLTEQWRRVAPYMLGDFYPLSGYDPGNDAWMAWQFDRPDLGEGMVQAFRRADSIYESVRLRLRGLHPDANYHIENLDAPEPRTMSGQELMHSGLPVAIGEQPGAVVIVYKRGGPL